MYKIPSNSSTGSMQYSILPSYQMDQDLIARKSTCNPTKDLEVPPYDLELPSLTRTSSNLQPNNIANTYSNSFTTPISSTETSYSSSSYSRDFSIESSSFTYSSELTSYESNNSNNLNSYSSGSNSMSNTKNSTELLATHHNLELSKLRSRVKLSMHFIKETGKPGGCNQMVEPHPREYSSGDHVHGFTIAENISSEPISFDTFYIFFEGKFVFYTGAFFKVRKPILIEPIIQAIDLTASSPFIESNTETEIDPVDGTYMNFHENQTLLPGLKYKRYFSFKVPEYLLNTNFPSSILSHHNKLPPTLDFEDLNSLFFSNSKITYAINAKFVTVESQNDAHFFTNLQDCTRDIRVIPKSISICQEERQQHEHSGKHDMHMGNNLKSLIGILEKNIEWFKQNNGAYKSLNCKSLYSLNDQTNGISNQNKLESNNNNNNFTKTISIKCKKFPFSREKFCGILQVTIATDIQTITYITPSKYSSSLPSQTSLESWNIDIPIKLEFLPNNEKFKPPEIINIAAHLVTFSYMTEKNTIPIELTNEMVYDQTGLSFKEIVQDPLRNLYNEMNGLIKMSFPNNNLPIEESIMKDIKTILSLKTKKNILEVTSTNIAHEAQSLKNTSSIPWRKLKNGLLEKQAKIRIPIGDAQHSKLNQESEFKFGGSNSNLDKTRIKDHIPVYDKYSLVPDFNNKYIGRKYYLSLHVLISDGSTIVVRIPLSIKKF